MRGPKVAAAAALVMVAVVAGSIGAGAAKSSPNTVVVGEPNTVWLCRPGQANDPCTGNLTTTVMRANGTTSIVRARSAKRAPIDCFYVYPTASTQSTPNAALIPDPGVVAAAQLQAQRFSAVCKMYVPLYRQLTLSGLSQTGITGSQPPPGTPTANFTEPYSDVQAAWNDYLSHYNHGRGVVIIGHSQGSFLLIQLISQEIEYDPSVRKRIVSVIVPGGNLQTGSFSKLPPCRSNKQIHCAVAYSSYPSMPPAGSIFGYPNGPTSSGAASGSVICTNPAALPGGSADLATYFPTDQNLLSGGTNQPNVTTPWVEYPDLFQGTCTQAGGATWLQVSDIRGSNDTRPHLTEALGPGWGYHLDDINLALGNLVRMVCVQSGTYLHKAMSCPKP
ncbi:MAG: DUF3089 domain-containing protein [Acidimicrobiales bacterium]